MVEVCAVFSYAFMSGVVTVWGSVGMFIVLQEFVKDSVLYDWSDEVCCVFVLGCDGCCVFGLNCEAWSCRCS